MGDTSYTVKIERHRDNDGGAYMRQGSQPQEETLPVLEAARKYGTERIIDLLEDQLRCLRKTVR